MTVDLLLSCSEIDHFRTRRTPFGQCLIWSYGIVLAAFDQAENRNALR